MRIDQYGRCNLNKRNKEKINKDSEKYVISVVTQYINNETTSRRKSWRNNYLKKNVWKHYTCDENINLSIQKSQQNPSRINTKRFILRQILIKFLKDRKSWKQLQKNDS